MQGQLFTQDFLARGILETEPWRNLSEAELDAFVAELRGVYGDLSSESTLNEGQTEDELIKPILALLGWQDAWMSQINLSESGRDDVPDFLLFPDGDAKARAMKEKRDDRRSRHGLALLEAKRWMRLLDRADAGAAGATKRRDFGAPSSQMLRYLSRADVMSAPSNGASSATAPSGGSTGRTRARGRRSSSRLTWPRCSASWGRSRRLMASTRGTA